MSDPEVKAAVSRLVGSAITEARGDTETSQAQTIFDELVSDLILTTAIQAHRDVKRSRASCGICETR